MIFGGQIHNVVDICRQHNLMLSYGLSIHCNGGYIYIYISRLYKYVTILIWATRVYKSQTKINCIVFSINIRFVHELLIDCHVKSEMLLYLRSVLSMYPFVLQRVTTTDTLPYANIGWIPDWILGNFKSA